MGPTAASVSLSDVAQNQVGAQPSANQSFGAPGSGAAFASPKPSSGFSAPTQSTVSAFAASQSSPNSFSAATNAASDFPQSLTDFASVKDLASNQTSTFSDSAVATPLSPFSQQQQQQRSATFQSQAQHASFAAPSSLHSSISQSSSSIHYTTASAHRVDSLEAPVTYANSFRTSVAMDIQNPDAIAEFRPSGNLMFSKADVDFHHPVSSAFGVTQQHDNNSYYNASRMMGSTYEQAAMNVDAPSVSTTYGATGVDSEVSNVFSASDYSMVTDPTNKDLRHSLSAMDFTNRNLMMDAMSRPRVSLAPDVNFPTDQQQHAAAGKPPTTIAKPKLNVCEVCSLLPPHNVSDSTQCARVMRKLE